MVLSSRTASQARRSGLLPFGAPPRGQSPPGPPPHPWDSHVRHLLGSKATANDSM